MNRQVGGEARDGCRHQANCAMYSLFKHAGTLAVFQMRYCAGDYEECARYQRAREGLSVPLNLMPNGQLLKKKA